MRELINKYSLAKRDNIVLINGLGNWNYEIYDIDTLDRLESFCRVGMNVNDSRKQAIEYFNNKY